ncbi:MAG: hypothetical protein LBP83_01650 [Dysgonamonadaceae bacterium]|jgi:hypothetical protein|nr:hypothetical protein [Dysgonamonadaceae bacterium]
MPIVFNKVERANPQDGTLPKKWYPALKTFRQAGEREVANVCVEKCERSCPGTRASAFTSPPTPSLQGWGVKLRIKTVMKINLDNHLSDREQEL